MPHSPETIDEYLAELPQNQQSALEDHRRLIRCAAFDTSKGTIRFQPDRPLPEPLVGTLVAVRLAEIRA